VARSVVVAVLDEQDRRATLEALRREADREVLLALRRDVEGEG
jgi:hypothetical protein